jgi:hypothetical protein
MIEKTKKSSTYVTRNGKNRYITREEQRNDENRAERERKLG